VFFEQPVWFLHWVAVMHVPVAPQIALPLGQSAWHAPAGPLAGFQIAPFGQPHSPYAFTIWLGAQQVAA
jgi:hypothetical protein